MTRPWTRFSKFAFLLLVPCSFACSSTEDEDGDIVVVVSNVGAALKGQSKDKKVVAGVNVSEDGKATTAGGPGTSVAVETRESGGAWIAAQDVVVDFNAPPLIDTVLVADNSGSEEGYLPEIAGAVEHFSHVILSRAHDDRVGLVRVSTQSTVEQALTIDAAEMKAGADSLFINKGWTALWDGVRLANEVLDTGAAESDGKGTACYSGAYRSIVVFTDSRDNNSADEHETKYPGDGIDTKLGDLLAMSAGGTTTPVYTVSVGKNADESALKSLAKTTGGQHAKISSYGGLVGALHGSAAKLQSLVPVCFTPHDCAASEARISVTKQGKTAETVFSIPNVCGG